MLKKDRKTTMLIKIKIYINGLKKMKNKKFNTLFFQKGNQRESGRSFTKLLIVQMFFYT